MLANQPQINQVDQCFCAVGVKNYPFPLPQSDDDSENEVADEDDDGDDDDDDDVSCIDTDDKKLTHLNPR